MKYSLELILLISYICKVESFVPSFSTWSLESSCRSRPSSLYAKSKKKKKAPSPIIATNRSARRNYEVISTFDAGISLLGSEIKAIRDGKMNIRDGFARPDKNGRGLS